MRVVGVDLGGTKCSSALFSEKCDLSNRRVAPLEGRTDGDVGALVVAEVKRQIDESDAPVAAVGICVPGISRRSDNTVWAPNIPGWDRYPLRDEVQNALGSADIPVTVDSDRTCYILGETWCGTAKGCRDAIFMAVGTGIGAGILVDGVILHGAADIAGATGWMGLQRPYDAKFDQCGCYEWYASGEGLARYARELLAERTNYRGVLSGIAPESVTAYEVFDAYDKGDDLAGDVLGNAIELWGMASANFISLFNPEKIVFGGGIFGPAKRFIDDIGNEAKKWAQPLAFDMTAFCVTELGEDAGLIGSGKLALDRVAP